MLTLEGVKQAGRDHAERAHALMKARAEEQERIKQNGGCIPGTHRVPRVQTQLSQYATRAAR
jgi:hypothetical protein